MSSESVIGLDTANVLLVEDNDDDAFLIEKQIDRGVDSGFVDDIVLTRVESLEAAIDSCESESFDAVFLDLGLPDSRGLETIERFTAQEFDLPVVVLTGLQDDRTSIEAIQQGAQDYLIKGDSTAETIIRAMRHAIERKENQRQLRRQRDQIEFFNSILRHDMLNGMQIIRLTAQGLEPRLDGEEEDDIQTIVNWSDNIVELTEKIKDILDAVTSGEQAELHPIRVQSVVARQVEEIEAMRAGVTVETEIPYEIEVEANDLFADVIRNLLTNAVDHTAPAAVTITISAHRTGTDVELVIEDDGPGVPNDKQDTLFNRGAKGSESSGSGLGLFFIETMVDTYDGEIRFETADPGARFVMTLPDRQKH